MILDNRDLYGSHGISGKRRIFSNLDEPSKSEQLTILKSADEFLKETSQLTLEFMSKSDMNNKDNQVSPRYLQRINEMLLRNNFAKLPKSQDTTSILQVLDEVLRSFDKFKFDSNENTELIFKKFYGRNSNPKNQTDCATFELMLAYENKIRSLQKEFSQQLRDENRRNEHQRPLANITAKNNSDNIEGLRHNFYKTQQELGKSKDMCASLSKELDENQKIVGDVCKVLSLKDPRHIVRSVAKLEKVLRAVPQLEQFIKEICNIVFPDIKEDKNFSQKMDEVIPKLKKSLSELHHFKRLRENTSKSQHEEKRSVTPRGSRREFSFEEQIVQHICHLYEINEEKSTILTTIDQTFIFVRELKSFLKLSREILGLDENVSLNEVLHSLKQLIKTV